MVFDLVFDKLNCVNIKILSFISIHTFRAGGPTEHNLFFAPLEKQFGTVFAGKFHV